MAGRKKAVIDWDRVDEMLAFQCSGVEIAEDLGVHPDTLYAACQREHNSDFSAYSQQKRARGTATARETFFKEAFGQKDPFDKTRALRQIFWLKNHADMSDKQEVKQHTTGTIEVVRFEMPVNGTDEGERSPKPSDWSDLVD
jgi:IS30 family transposase